MQGDWKEATWVGLWNTLCLFFSWVQTVNYTGTCESFILEKSSVQLVQSCPEMALVCSLIGACAVTWVDYGNGQIILENIWFLWEHLCCDSLIRICRYIRWIQTGEKPFNIWILCKWNKYCRHSSPIYWDRSESEHNSAEPWSDVNPEGAALIRIYTVCHSHLHHTYCTAKALQTVNPFFWTIIVEPSILQCPNFSEIFTLLERRLVKLSQVPPRKVFTHISNVVDRHLKQEAHGPQSSPDL